MELDPNDYDVVKLLTKLKSANGVYPPELMTPRRQTYLRRVAEIGLGFGVVAGLKAPLKNGGKAGSFSSSLGGLIEVALILFIVTEAGAAAYVYREQISEYFKSFSSQSKVEEVTSAPETIFSTDLPELVLTQLPEATPTPEISGTPSPSVTVVASAAAINTQNNQGDQNNPGSQSNSTPDPNGNNGNHFGQTPKPDRTAEPGTNNNDNNNNISNNGNGK
jgi:hypothetical protein